MLKRAAPALDGWVKINQPSPDDDLVLDDDIKNALNRIEMARTKKQRKLLANRLYYRLYGGDDTYPEPTREPPCIGFDITGKPYAF